MSSSFSDISCLRSRSGRPQRWSATSSSNKMPVAYTARASRRGRSPAGMYFFSMSR
jgi:hypothetical protein